MAISAALFVIRIRVEEEMLIDEFGDAYREYQKRTKMLILLVY
jgi:protein-S-isoprenylcysteine O-methyltransferase Ste14